MKTIVFSYKIEARLQFVTADLVISEISKNEILLNLKSKLKNFHYCIDVQSVGFVLKEDGLYAEGFANEISKPVLADLLIS